MAYFQKRSWVECGPGKPGLLAMQVLRRAGARRRVFVPFGLGDTGPIATDAPMPVGVWVSNDPAAPISPAPPAPLPPVYGLPYVPPPPDVIPCLAGGGPLQPGQVYCTPYNSPSTPMPSQMPCLMGSGPLQPGQVYCDTTLPAPAGGAVASAVSSLWSSVQPYALPIGLTIAVVALVASRGGRR